MFKTKIRLLLLSALILIGGGSAFAATAYTDTSTGLKYSIDTSKKTATLTYISNVSGKNYTEITGEFTVPATVTYNDVEYPVTTLNTKALANMPNVTKITIPASVTAFNSSGSIFQNDPLLEEVVFEEGSTLTTLYASTFSNCPKLTKVTLPASLTATTSNMFQNCTSLESVYIPSKVTSMNANTFSGCTALKTVTGMEGMTSLSASLFSNLPALTELYVPESVTTISGTFSGSDNLRKIYGLKNTITFAKNQFTNLTGLEEVIFESGNTATSRSFGSSVTNVFDGCSKLTNVVLPDNLTSIPGNTFLNCTALETIYIPSKVSSITKTAFEGCTALKSVTGMEGLTTFTTCFQNLTALETFTWPAKITTVISNAFDGCTSLREINGLENVTTINEKAFMNCPALETLTWPSKCTTINANTFDGCASLKTVPGMSVITSYKDNAFQNWTGLEEFEWSSSITTIPDYMFSGCVKLKKVTNLDNVTRIDTYAFNGCVGLETFAWPSKCTTIYGGVFSGCVNLKEVTNIQNVTTLSANAFQGCTGLETFTLPSKITALANYVFDGCTSLREIIGTSQITSIGTYALQNCESLPSYDFNSKLTSISAGAFKGCKSLTNVVIPETVTSLGKSAFQSCSSLTEIVLPAKLTTLNDSAFTACTSLKKVTITAHAYSSSANTLNLGLYTFKDCTALKEVVFGTSSTTTAVTLDGTGVFQNTPALETLVLPDYLVTVNARVFNYANGLKNLTFGVKTTTISAGSATYDYFKSSQIENLTFPINLTNINNYTFSGMPKLKTVTLAENLTTMSNSYLFQNCPELETVNFPARLTNWTGSNNFEGCTALKNINFGTALTGITGSNNFKGCTALNTVTFPETMASITGSNNFDGCESLTQVNFPAGFTALEGSSNFANCGLTSISFPDGMDHIYGNYQFQNNKNLTVINWGKNLNSVLKAASGYFNTDPKHFDGCTALTTVNFPAELESLTAPYLLQNLPVTELNFAEGSKLASIAAWTFFGMPDLEKVTLPGNLKSVEKNVFAKALSLKEVTFTTGLNPDKAGQAMFWKCANLTTVNFSDDFTTIGLNMFRECSSLTEVTLPRDLETVGQSAFLLTNLQKVNYNEKLVTLSDSCFYQGLVNKVKPHADVNVYLPKSIEHVGNAVFWKNKGVNALTFDNPNLNYIGDYAFYGIELPKLDLAGTALTYIGKYAFAQDNTNLTTTEVIFPATMKTIGDNSIKAYDAVKRITFLSEVPPAASISGTCCFGGPSALIFTNAYAYVPPKSLDNYRTCSDTHLQRFFYYKTDNDFRDRFRAITDFQLSENEITRYIPCENEVLTATIKDYETLIENPAVKWVSDNEDIVTVDENGTLAFKAPGQAFVTATYVDEVYGELTAKCRVNVYDHAYEMAIEQPQTMYVNDRQRLFASAMDAINQVYVNDATITWTVATPGLISVDENGEAVALAPGIAQVIASWTDEYEETHSITAYITISPEDGVDFGTEKQIAMYVNTIHEFTEPVATHRGEPVDNGQLSWSSANSDIVMVSSDGRIFGCKPGVAMVYASYNGIKVPCTVTVLEPGMYNLTISMPDARGNVHVMGLQGETELQFKGNENENGVKHFVDQVSHDGVDVTDQIVKGLTWNNLLQYLDTYKVSGPLHADETDPMMLAALSDEGDVASAVPYTTIEVYYTQPLVTGVDDMEMEGYGIRIYSENNTVTVVGATEGAVLTIYDVAGRILYQGTEHTVTLDATGVLLLNVDNNNYKFKLN